MVNIRKLLTPQECARLDATRDEIARLYALPDRWLAEELLRIARATRQQFPEKLSNPQDIIYDSNFVWHVVPEVAKRLGATRLQSNEATDPDVVSDSDAELRHRCGIYLLNLSIGTWAAAGGEERSKPSASEILTHEVANGNPIAFAVDRLAPAPESGADQDDYIARTVREISARRGFEVTPYWSPDLQPNPSEVASEDDDNRQISSFRL